MSRVPLLALTLTGLVVLGCGDGEEGTYIDPVEVQGEPTLPRGDPPFHPDERPRPPDDLDWERCALFSDGADRGAECATIEVPLRWRSPHGERIELFLKRYRTSSTPRGQLWLLAGGPGGSGAEFEPQVFDDPRDGFYPSFAEMAPGFEIYLLDHRGTGRSSRLGCVAGEDPASPGGIYLADEEWGTCVSSLRAEWGGRLDGFTTTEAAKDLGELIARTRHGDEPVFVYGVSYGTAWAERYLHLYPDQATGVVLDGICSPGPCELSLGYDAGFDEVGHDVLELCAADAACSAAFPEGVEGALDEVFAMARNGDCAEFGLDLDPSDVRVLLGLLLRSWPLRDLVPATIARLRECDGEAIARLSMVLDPGVETVSDRLYSVVLNRHIGISEFFRVPPPSVEETRVHVDSLEFSLDIGPSLVKLLDEGWPIYEPDELAASFPDTRIPILMMNGTLDPQTPLSITEETARHFSAPHQTFVEVPYAAHSVVNQSPITLSEDGTLETCGEALLQQFIADPEAPLDTSCTDEVIEPGFANHDLVTAVFGSADPFANSRGERARRSRMVERGLNQRLRRTTAGSASKRQQAVGAVAESSSRGGDQSHGTSR